MKKVIVTGAAGFAGYSLTTHLLQHGYEVFAILRPDSHHNERLVADSIVKTLKQDLKKGSLGSISVDSIITEEEIGKRLHSIELDSSEYQKLPSLINEKIDVIFHLTWVGGRDNYDEQYANIAQTIATVEAAEKIGCKRFVCTGSQAEYGALDELISETLLPAPNNAYGAAKVAALYLSKRRCEQLGVEWVWGRIFSLYGLYEPSGRMLPDLVAKLKAGETMHLSSCRQNWDYLDAGDAAEAIIALGEKGRSGEIYNIANGDYKSLREFVDEIRNKINPECVIEFGDDPNPFVSLKPDVSKIKNDTGWKCGVRFMNEY